MAQIFRRFVRLTVYSLLASVLTLGAQEPEAVSTAVAAPIIAPSADYLLRPSDILQMRVFQEDDLTREISVSGDFTISLPLIGTVDVKNRSVRQTEEMVRQLYDRDFLVNPQVSLIVLKYAERAVNVIGQVNTPRAVEFPAERGLTLLEAIARAGGFTRLAERSKVKLIRKDDKGVPVTYTINAEKLINATSDNTWTLQVDDVIEVPERFL